MASNTKSAVTVSSNNSSSGKKSETAAHKKRQDELKKMLGTKDAGPSTMMLTKKEPRATTPVRPSEAPAMKKATINQTPPPTTGVPGRGGWPRTSASMKSKTAKHGRKRRK